MPGLEGELERGWQEAFTISGSPGACKIKIFHLSFQGMCGGQREGETPVEEGNLGGSVAETANLGEI